MPHVIILNQQGKQKAAAWIQKAPDDGSWLVEFKENKSSRSLEQNALSWIWYRAIADFLTDNSDETISDQDVHDWLCDKFLPKRIVTIDGEQKAVTVGTSKLKVNEMCEYLLKVEQWAADRRIPLEKDDRYNKAMGIL